VRLMCFLCVEKLFINLHLNKSWSFFQRTKKVIGHAEAYDRLADISWLSSLCVAKATAFITLNR